MLKGNLITASSIVELLYVTEKELNTEDEEDHRWEVRPHSLLGLLQRQTHNLKLILYCS